MIAELPGLVAAVQFGRWRGRLNCRERLDDVVAMPRMSRNQPGVPWREVDDLPFDVELGAALNHIADGLIVADRIGFRNDRLVLPQAHGNALARNEIGLPHAAFGRVGSVNLFDRRVCRV